MNEGLNHPHSSEQSIENIASDSPNLHFISNFHNYTNFTDTREQYKYIEGLRKKYGEDNVKVTLAMIDGKPTAIPEMFGIYVDAQKWAELNPPKSDS